MFLSVLSFLLGILICQQWQMLPDITEIVLVIMVALLLAYFNCRRVCYLLLGLVYASSTAHYYLSNQLAFDLQANELLVQGEIKGLPEYNDQRARFDFLITESSVPLPDKVRLSWYYPEKKIAAGQIWKFYVKLKRPHGTLNPGGFDYEKWLFIRYIGATGYIRNADKAILIDTKSAWLSISRLRQSLSELLDLQTLPPENRALIKALTIGDKSQISRQQWQVLSKTGTTHLMAISGLHIGLIAGMVYWLFFRCWLRLPSNAYSAPQVAACFASIAALLYAALAGFSIPTQRALIMLNVLMLTIVLRRQVKAMNIFALALLTVLIIDPLVVLSAGFYLSFLAVFCIIYVFSSRLGRESKLSSSLKIHVVVALGLLPVLLLFFQSFSLIAPLANLIAVPVVSFVVVPMSLLALLFLPFVPKFAALLLEVVDVVLQVLWQVLSLLVELPLASIIRPEPMIWQMLLAMLGVLLILAPRGIPGRFLGVTLLLPMFLIRYDKPVPGAMNLTLLDVGQGLAVVIETAEHSLVFDAGVKFSDRYDMGRHVVLPFLHSRHITALDKLIVSHGDNDHMGGAEAVLDSIDTRKVFTSVAGPLAVYNAELCKKGYKWQWDQVTFHFLSPPDQLFDDENNNSCVLKIDSLYGSALLTGDIELAAEQHLVEHASEFLPADVLVAAHHGSKTSSSAEFLFLVKPITILIPAGTPNRFGFPHSETLERYRQLEAKYYISGENGAIKVAFTKQGIVMKSYREKHGRYWNNRVGKEK